MKINKAGGASFDARQLADIFLTVTPVTALQ